MNEEFTKIDIVNMAIDCNVKGMRAFMTGGPTLGVVVAAELWWEYGYWASWFNYFLIGGAGLGLLFFMMTFLAKSKRTKLVKLLTEHPETPMELEVNGPASVLKIGTEKIGVTGMFNKQKYAQIMHYFEQQKYANQ
jgi:hypothetical protein